MKTANRPRPSPTAFYNGQPIEFAMCRQFGKAMRLGDLMYVDELLALPAKVLPIRDWHVVGPFKSPTPGEIDFGMSTPVEDAFSTPASLGEGNVDLSAAYETPGQSVRWQATQGDAEGVVDLDGPLGRVEWAAAYGYTQIDSPREQAVLIALGSDDSLKVWLNGRGVHVYPAGRTCLRKMNAAYFTSPLQDFVTFQLRKGVNRLLVRVNNFTMGWGFVVGTVKEQA
jgi:hypothetical protein